MALRTRPESVFDPFDPEFLDDPYPVYARLRDAGPVVRDGATQLVVARHEQVSALLRDPRLRSEWPDGFQQMRLGAGPAKDFVLHSVLHREGADHTVLRRLLNNAMHATGAAELRAATAAVADAALDRAVHNGQLDVMADLAVPVPVAVACDLIGIPAGDRPSVERWGLEIIKAFTVILPEAERAGVDAAVAEMRDYLADRLARGGAGKLASIHAGMQAGAQGRAGAEELADNLIFLLVSGFTTTVHAIATVGSVLLSNPQAYAELRADRSLVRSAVEECLRFDAPIQHISRYAAEPIPVGDVTIRPGRVVHLLLGSANRDERQFTEPDRIDLRRDPNPHVSFGAGGHMCLGAGLGRLETAVVLERLLDRCASLTAAGDLVRRPVQVFRTFERLPATVRGS